MKYKITSDRWSRDEVVATLEEIQEQAKIFQNDRSEDEPTVEIIPGYYNGKNVLRDETGEVFAEEVGE
jgi:hypothetical protein